MKPLASGMPSMPTPTPNERGQQRQARGEQRPERDREHEDGDDHAERLADRRLGLDRRGGPAVLDLRRRAAGGCRDRVGLRGGHVGLHDRELQVRVSDPAVLGDGAGLERVGRRRDGGHAGEALDGLLDRRLVDRLALGRGEHDAAGRAVGVGLRHVALDQLDRRLGLRARDLELVRERALERPGQPAERRRGRSATPPSTSRRRRTEKYPSRCSSRAMFRRSRMRRLRCVAEQGYIVMQK